MRQLAGMIFESQNRACQVDQGIFSRTRVGAVAGLAMGMQPDERNALVVADKTQVRRLGCQHPIRPERESGLSGKMLQRVLHADASEFLVRLADQDHVATQGSLAKDTSQCGDECRHAGLCIARAATRKPTVLDDRIEGVDLHTVDRHRIEVRSDEDGIEGVAHAGFGNDALAVVIANADRVQR